MSVSPNRRLEAVRVMLKLEKKQIQDILQSGVYNYREVEFERKPVPSNWIHKLHELYNINPNWIILGKGDVFC